MNYYAKRFFGQNESDSDALAFITAAGLTDNTQINAINTLVYDLKGAGIWNKMKAIYPFIGGTADSHKWNLKDARDLDAAFRLQFVGAWLHSNNGVKIDSLTVTSYARTFFVPSLNFTSSSANMSIYSRTFTSNYNVLIGGGTLNSFIQQNVNSFLVGLGNTAYLTYTGANIGLLSSNRISQSNLQALLNGEVVVNSQNNYINYASRELYIGNYTNTTSFQNTSSIAFASFGEGLTESESLQFYTAVQNYQTTLNRQI